MASLGHHLRRAAATVDGSSGCVQCKRRSCCTSWSQLAMSWALERRPAFVVIACMIHNDHHHQHHHGYYHHHLPKPCCADHSNFGHNWRECLLNTSTVRGKLVISASRGTEPLTPIPSPPPPHMPSCSHPLPSTPIRSDPLQSAPMPSHPSFPPLPALLLLSSPLTPPSLPDILAGAQSHGSTEFGCRALSGAIDIPRTALPSHDRRESPPLSPAPCGRFVPRRGVWGGRAWGVKSLSPKGEQLLVSRFPHSALSKSFCPPFRVPRALVATVSPPSGSRWRADFLAARCSLPNSAPIPLVPELISKDGK